MHCEEVFSARVVAVGFELVVIGVGEVFYAVALPRICRQRKLRSFQQAFGIQRMMLSVMVGNLMTRATINTKTRIVKMGWFHMQLATLWGNDYDETHTGF